PPETRLGRAFSETDYETAGASEPCLGYLESRLCDTPPSTVECLR
ncbi:hypothetical protein A2U01_0094935, partial [Trifolium medium]|nr:hypothetical protein [Trifolium medium]